MVGRETIPLEELAIEIPWLPMDDERRPATLWVDINLTKEPYDNLLLRRDVYREVGILFRADEAQVMLGEAGQPRGERLPPLLLVVDGSPRNQAVVDTVAALWRDVLGLTVEVERIEGDYYGMIDSEWPGLYQAGWTVDVNDLDYTMREDFHSESVYNYGGFNRRDYDQIVDEAAELAGAPRAPGTLYPGRTNTQR